MQTAATQAFRDERALVLRHRAADLQQQLVVRILTHGAVEELDVAASPFELFEEHHLVHVIARQTIRGGEPHQVTARGRHRIAQGIQFRTLQRGAAEAVVAKDQVGMHLPCVLRAPGAQPLQLLFTGLVVGLSLGRHANVERAAHRRPPGQHLAETR